MDDIQCRTSCELHIPVRNVTTRVAYGMASPPNTSKTYHGGQIPDGFAVVSLDQIVEGYEQLEMDMPGGEGEKVLAEALHGFILW